MGIHNAVKNILKQAIEEEFPNGAYEGVAPDNASFPYAVFDLERVTEEPVERIQLDIRAWDKGEYPDRIDDMLDRLQIKMNGMVYKKEGLSIRIFKGTIRQAVPDPDRTIRGIRTTYEISLFGGGESGIV